MIPEILVCILAKYSSGAWVEICIAEDIIKYTAYYLKVSKEEISEIERDYLPTPLSNLEYIKNLQIQFKRIRRGNRYDKASV